MEWTKMKRLLAAAILIWGGTLYGAVALTTIQETVQFASGKRASGFLMISNDAFVATDGSIIPAGAQTVMVFNGLLKTALTPYTGYLIEYHLTGAPVYQETWSVPTSSTPLRISDVRTFLTLPTSSGALPNGSGNYIVATPADGSLGISALRHMVPADLPFTQVDYETPGGTINNTNLVFTLAYAPNPVASLDLKRNGLSQANCAVVPSGQPCDYNTTGNTVTFVSGAVPQVGDDLSAAYRY
jgi:hypothetical protein